jgi:hypothetical protein
MISHHRCSLGSLAIAAALLATLTVAHAFDESKYPNWRGPWHQLGGSRTSSWDPSKPVGAAQQAPLTSEYQAIFEASLRREAEGGVAADPTRRCIPAGFPRVMMAARPMEIVITPSATYFILQEFNTLRRVYTDGRKFPGDLEPSYTGYSIGQWQDSRGNGNYDTLVIETRGMRGPHAYDASGIPFHKDGEAVVGERIHADATDPDILHDEITTVDHALTRPWTVMRSYGRAEQQALLDWSEHLCIEDAGRVEIGEQIYKVSPEGLLMPNHRGQKAPDLGYFK